MPTVGAVTEAPPLISPKALSDALAALGAYAEPPTAAQLAAAEFAQGRTGLVTQLSNALYGSALAHVMTAELAVAQGRF
jgi:3-dehydroquinate dehydratase